MAELMRAKKKEIRRHISRNRSKVYSLNKRQARGAPRLTKSQSIAMRWRRIYGLPPLTRKARPDAVKDLSGMLKGYADYEDPVEVVKESRQNLYRF